MNNLTDNDAQLIQLNPAVVLGDIDGELVALSMESSAYLHLNSSGSYIIDLLSGEQPRSLAWLCQQLQQEYDIDSVRCREEVDSFVSRCIDLNLLRVVSAPI